MVPVRDAFSGKTSIPLVDGRAKISESRQSDREGLAIGEVVGLAFLAALNPTLLAATTVMLLLPRPDRLMLGYWLGAMLTGVTLGLVIVLALPKNSSFAKTSQRTVSPAIDLAIAGILLIVVVVLATGRDKPLEERHAEKRGEKKPPKWQQRLQTGTAMTTFAIGVLLSFPGASYLVALDRLNKLHYTTAVTVLVVIGIMLVQLVLLEVALLAFVIAPEQTPIAIDRGKAWGQAHWRTYAMWGLSVIVAALVIRGIVALR
jgi:hypothetical protein